jgi:hypothetical protein
MLHPKWKIHFCIKPWQQHMHIEGRAKAKLVGELILPEGP